MPRCELSGVGPVVKNLVSHSNIKTKSRACPNIHKKSFYSPNLKRYFRAKVSASTLKNIDKMGSVDIYILKQPDLNLSARILKIKKLLKKKINNSKKQVKRQEVK